MYDLFTIADLAPSVTDRDLIQDIQRHLLEPVNATSWVGSEQFTYTGVVNALQTARDKFLLETGIVLTVSEFATGASPVSIIALPANLIDVRRAMWKTAQNIYSILWKADPHSLTGFVSNWLSGSTIPSDYSIILNQPLVLQVTPPAAAQGSLHLIHVNSGGTLNPASAASILGIPDDLTWVVKFGALANLFMQDGPGQDSARAEYCEGRWKEGIQLARITNFVRFGYQTGVPSFVDSMSELDGAEPNWMNSQGASKNLVVMGNIAAVNPVSNSASITLGFDITPKFPIPGLGDNIQVGKEVIDVILDYAQHLAMIKEGAEEIKASMHQYKNLVMLAATQNDRLRAQSNNFDVLTDRSNRETHPNPRRKSDISKNELNYSQESQ